MEYNTSRGDLEYREYGRTINKVIDNVCNYPDGEKKNTATRAIVYMMAQVAGISVKDDLSYHKLWDHLMILSEFRLQQAWPFTPQELQQLKERIASGDQHQHGRLTYSNNKITTRYYGANLEKMLHKMKEMPNGEEYDADTAFEFTNEYEAPAKPVKPSKTGDTTMIMNYMILFAASVMLLLALLQKQMR